MGAGAVGGTAHVAIMSAGAVDAQLAVKRDASDDITLEVEWMKDGPEGDVVHSRLQAVEVGTDDHRHPITSCES
jgi:hypothetical protein